MFYLPTYFRIICFNSILLKRINQRSEKLTVALVVLNDFSEVHAIVWIRHCLIRGRKILIRADSHSYEFMCDENLFEIKE